MIQKKDKGRKLYSSHFDFPEGENANREFCARTICPKRKLRAVYTQQEHPIGIPLRQNQREISKMAKLMNLYTQDNNTYLKLELYLSLTVYKQKIHRHRFHFGYPSLHLYFFS